MSRETSETGATPVAALTVESAVSIAERAMEARKAATPEALLFNYVFNVGSPKGRNLPTVAKMFQTAFDLGHAAWPLSLRALAQQKDVLHYGCGATLYGPVFRALGAKSYTGIDRTLDPGRKKFRSRLEKKTVATDFSLVDAMGLIPGLSYMQAEDVVFQQAFDVVLMLAVTHNVASVDALFAQIHRALRPNGEVWFNHENYFSWAGHMMAPRSPAAYDSSDPAQRALVDWGHVLSEAPEGHRQPTSSRLTPTELRAVANRYFEVSQWVVTPERTAVAERLTPELRGRLSAWSDQDLLTRQIVCRAVKRELG